MRTFRTPYFQGAGDGETNHSRTVKKKPSGENRPGQTQKHESLILAQDERWRRA